MEITGNECLCPSSATDIENGLSKFWYGTVGSDSPDARLFGSIAQPGSDSTPYG